MTATRIAKCRCGRVQCEALGAPILTAVCYCDDCQAGGKLIEALPDAPPVLEPDGGASYLTYRDDRWRCTAGADLLKGYKLQEKSPTTRYATTCCNTAMYLKFKPGHWVSTYRNCYEGDTLPAIEMRTNIRFRTSTMPLPDSAPTYKRFPFRLFGKLIAARISMALGRD